MLKDALVLFSGGQDSTTCLYWAKEKFKSVTALNMNYGQRHANEIDAAHKIASMAGIGLLTHNLDVFKNINAQSALLNDTEDISAPHVLNKKLPASFVPGRNVLFLTIAAMIAYNMKIRDIVTGVCETDFSGYPDCRDNTIKSLQITLNLAFGCDNIVLHTPLMWKTKAQTVRMAQKYMGCWEALEHSVTCYNGQKSGCGECPACKLREKGFAEAGMFDPAKMNSI